MTLYADNVLLFQVINSPERLFNLNDDIENLGTAPTPTILHSIGINANTWLFHTGKLYLSIITNFCLKAILLALFSGPAQLSVACSMDSDGKLGGAWEWDYILWNRWKCSSVWVFSYHMISLGVNMFNVQSVCSKARKILCLLYTRFYDNVPGSNSLLQLFTSLDYASAIWSPYLSKENVQKICMLHGYWTMGHQSQRSPGTCWPSNT